ncbi:MAG: helix-turn-helix transcriptional regulator [Terracidiphilus sp.]|nr:helix-turn-helix transcriptional regulator [Terracidiphilus sp.]
MSAFSDSFAAEIKRLIKERGITVTAAASELGITRQALYNYLNAKSTPRDKKLASVMHLWKLRITVGSVTIDETSFPTPKPHSAPAKQLDMWDKLNSIKQEDLRIGVKRSGNLFKVSVEIDIPA